MADLTIVKENETELKLKEYFKKLIDLAGYDYALVTLSTEDSIKDSITSFSNRFDNCTDLELTMALLKAGILEGQQKDKIVKSLIEDQHYEDLAFLVNYNFGIRRALTRDFMNHCYESNESTYEKKDNKEEILARLATLKTFEETIKHEKVAQIEKVL